jgi:2-iminobutanoate/2-iminopropanoate deaminase
MDRTIVLTDQAPAPIGPYSQAVKAGDLVFCSGQIPLDPRTGRLVEGTLAEQVNRVMDNLEAVLREARSSLARTVKLTVYMTDLKDFEVLNKVLVERFPKDPPARAVVQVSALPKGAAVEVDLIALK